MTFIQTLAQHGNADWPLSRRDREPHSYNLCGTRAPGKPRATAAALAAARACSSHDTAFFDFFLPPPALLPPPAGCAGIGRVTGGSGAAVPGARVKAC